MNKAKEIELKFREYAFSKGYTQKVVEGYRKSRNPNSKLIKMISSKGDKIIVNEGGEQVILKLTK